MKGVIALKRGGECGCGSSSEERLLDIVCIKICITDTIVRHYKELTTVS